jgi:hypothetical protein
MLFSALAERHGRVGVTQAPRSARTFSAGFGSSAVAALPLTFDNAGSLPTSAGDLTITAASALRFSAATC